MIDVQTVKDANNSFEISDVAIVKSEFNIANAPTKLKANLILMDTILNRKVDHPVEQWKIRTKLQNEVSTAKTRGMLT